MTSRNGANYRRSVAELKGFTPTPEGGPLRPAKPRLHADRRRLHTTEMQGVSNESQIALT